LINGKLVAKGLQTAPVTFTSERDDTVCGRGVKNELICDTNNDGNSSLPAALDWGWIEFGSSSSPASVIQRTVIKYGGKSYGWRGTVRLNNVVPTLENITFKGNYRNAVEIMPVNWETHTWNSSTIIYWLSGDTTLLPNETLRILPGVKIKATTHARLLVNGKLVADGIPTAKIAFTSEKDDTVCGRGVKNEPICDTNNDLNASLPAAANWGGLEFGTSSDATSLIRQALILYGTRGIRLNSASPKIAYSRFKTNYRGLELHSGSRPNLTCNNFESNQDYGVYNYQPTTVVKVERHWWNSIHGPTHPANPKGTGDRVSDGLDYTPWAKQSCLSPGSGSDHFVYLPVIQR
jgi:hypothetical protein